MTCCPTCGRPQAMVTDAPSLAAEVEALRAEALGLGMAVDWKGYVAHADAAALLSMSPKTLSNRKRELGLASKKIGREQRYRLDDLARVRSCVLQF